MARSRRRARASSQAGPRRPDGSFYAQKPSGKRRSRKGKKVVTSKSGRTYKKTASGNWSLVRGKKSRKSRKGGKRRGRR